MKKKSKTKSKKEPKEEPKTFGGISKSYAEKRESLRRSYLTEKQREQEKPTLQEAQKRLDKQERQAKVDRVKKIGSRAIKRLTAGKALRKPTAKLPNYSARKVLMKGANQGALVREGRTGFFNDEYVKETKWLS